MRRTTQWAVFTSMNRQQPAWRTLYEPPQRAGSTDTPFDASSTVSPQAESDTRSAPDTRRDRVDFM